jgi:hypothetical protein
MLSMHPVIRLEKNAMDETPDMTQVHQLDEAVQRLVDKADRLRQELAQVEAELLQMRDADMNARRAMIMAEKGEAPPS